MTFSDRVKMLREMQGLSQSAVARRAGVARSHVVLIEQGVRANPTLSILRKLAHGLGVSLPVLTGDEVKAASSA